MSSRPRPHDIVTARRTLGQVVVCVGCCCGRTDKGHPEVPVDWLKQEWRKRTLPKKIQLTISGCLGPCDITNVVLVMMGDHPVWLGGLDRHDQFVALADWASACDAAGQVVPLPDSLAPYRFDRFQAAPPADAEFGPQLYSVIAEVA